MFWNVRLTPSAAIRVRAQPGQLARRRSATVPAVGAVDAGEHVQQVDLPAPLGPMTACVRAGRDVSETSSSAVEPAEADGQVGDRGRAGAGAPAPSRGAARLGGVTAVLRRRRRGSARGPRRTAASSAAGPSSVTAPTSST